MGASSSIAVADVADVPETSTVVMAGIVTSFGLGAWWRTRRGATAA